MTRRKLSDYLGEEPKGKCLSEQDVKLIVEKTIAVFLPGIIEKLNELSREVFSIREDLRKIQEECRHRMPAIRAERPRGGKKPSKISEKIRIILSEEGFAFASQLAARLHLSPTRLLDIARDLEYVLLDLGGDYAIIDPYSMRELSQLLSRITTSDPVEASRELGKYSPLFEKLRSQSLVIYDGRIKRWRIIQ